MVKFIFLSFESDGIRLFSRFSTIVHVDMLRSQFTCETQALYGQGYMSPLVQDRRVRDHSGFASLSRRKCGGVSDRLSSLARTEKGKHNAGRITQEESKAHRDAGKHDEYELGQWKAVEKGHITRDIVHERALTFLVKI